MGLSFSTLVRAALGGSAAYSSGKRQGEDDKEKKDQLAAALQRQATQDAMSAELHRAQIEEYQSLAKDRDYRTNHPEEFRVAHNPTATEEFKTEYEKNRAAGMTPVEAHRAASLALGKEAPPLRRGDPGYLQEVADEAEAHAKAAAKYRTKQEWEVYGPSTDYNNRSGAADLRAKRTYITSRIGKGISPGQAAKEWDLAGAGAAGIPIGALPDGGEDGAGDVSDPYSSTPGKPKQKELRLPPAVVMAAPPGTAHTMARSIPSSVGPSQSANAGSRGPRPAAPTSTPSMNPRAATSPKVGTLRPRSPGDTDAAITAVGADPKKVRSWLIKNGIQAN